MKQLKSFSTEIILVLILGFLTLSVLDVVWMPMGVQIAVLSVLVVVFAAYAIYGLREHGGDEREVAILHKSDRVAFFAGATVLLIAVVYESVVHHMTIPWAVCALFVMVLAKTIGYVLHNRS